MAMVHKILLHNAVAKVFRVAGALAEALVHGSALSCLLLHLSFLEHYYACFSPCAFIPASLSKRVITPIVSS